MTTGGSEMSVLINISNNENAVIHVTHYEDENAPWCAVKIGSGERRVAIYASDEQLRELVAKINVAMRPVTEAAECAWCTEAATHVVTLVENIDGDVKRRNLCQGDAELALKDISLTRTLTCSPITVNA